MAADLRLIATFVQAARRESFSGAAKALGISAGAVSQNIKSLEDQLGARLFTRTTRQVKLTPEGQRYLLRCAPALEALDEATVAIKDERDSFSGRLRITSTTAFGRSHVLPVIAAFQDAHPDLSIELSLSDQFVDLVAEEFDLAIRGGILKDSNYISRLLLPVTPVVCAAPSYFKAQGKPKQIADLTKHRLIGMRSNLSQELFSWEFSGKRGQVEHIKIKPHFVINDPEGAALAAVKGLGIAQVGTNVVLPKVRDGQLVLALTDFAVQSRGIYAVYPTRRFAPKKLSAFISALAEAFAERSDLISF
jgi:DNA-binding transcriptional LysR family regulator